MKQVWSWSLFFIIIQYSYYCYCSFLSNWWLCTTSVHTFIWKTEKIRVLNRALENRLYVYLQTAQEYKTVPKIKLAWYRLPYIYTVFVYFFKCICVKCWIIWKDQFLLYAFITRTIARAKHIILHTPYRKIRIGI